MPSYFTPGVYFERTDSIVPAITALRTDIGGFVGIAERGPLHRATPVQSWRQFQATFGNFIGGGYLAYAVKGFFENGGRKCYVVRVADRDLAESASVLLPDSDPIPANRRPAWRIEASSPGVWGNQLAVSLRTTHRAQTRTVFVPGTLDAHRSRVQSVTNFEVGAIVRLFQPGPVPARALGVVAGVDGEQQRLEWVDPLPAAFAPSVPIYLESIEYTLSVYWRGRLVSIYENLSVVPEHERYGPDVVCFSQIERSDSRSDILPPPPPFVLVPREVEPGRDLLPPLIGDGLVLDTERPVLLSGGWDGLETLSVDDFIGEPEDPMANEDVRKARRRGLRAIEVIDEISAVAVPDIHIQPAIVQTLAPEPCEPDPCLPDVEPESLPTPPIFPGQPPTFSDDEVYQVQSAMVAQCEEKKDRFALLDPPFSTARDGRLGTGAILSWRSRFDTKYAAFYFSWLRVMDPLRLDGKLVRAIPPSGHVAGVFADTDLTVGVHKAPANVELAWAEDTTVAVDDVMQAGLNPRGINAIRSFPGRGLRIYGARTVSSDPDWRFVNVRRLLIMIEEALDISTQWVVFEGNDAYTRSKVRLAITSFLEALWRRGALAGAQPDEAFFVRCDEDNNPPTERELGRLHVDVGVAPSNPCEFIVLRLGRTEDEFELTEQ